MSREIGPIGFYHRHASELARRYDAMAFEAIHKAILPWLPQDPGLVLDVGAGSGRDAAWFAAQGHEVFAVEPARDLRDQAAAGDKECPSK